jgi:hypothetical protein
MPPNPGAMAQADLRHGVEQSSLKTVMVRWLDQPSCSAPACRRLGTGPSLSGAHPGAVGVGWSAKEFAALGIPFARRGQRAAEYVAAMRELWAEDVASFSGEFTRFEGVRVNPKPVRARRIPIVFGGNSDPALKRAAAFGDGWYGFNVPTDAVTELVVVAAPPEDPAAASGWVAELADHWGIPRQG